LKNTRVQATSLLKIRVEGVVQGVGFRPFIYRLAREHNLDGWVCNTSGGVEIEVEGQDETLQDFLRCLESEAPDAARIEKVTAAFHSPRGYAGFSINRSLPRDNEYQLISPDIATCDDCRREIFSDDDRRYLYPFTNCTNCGPRFTIIENIPYDRAKTTMRNFRMCPECRGEYDNPLDRRFHAQPNACPVCGPTLELVDKDGNPIAEPHPVRAAANLLKSGKILAIKGLGGFHLACDATNERAVSLLRARKKRPSKPLAVMVATSEEIKKHCLVSGEEEELLRSPECPIVLLEWKSETSNIVPGTAPNLKHLGVMLPYTPLHHIMLNEARVPLVMTSGNISEEPIARDKDEALSKLKGIADFFLLHNRDIYSRYDDSVCTVEDIGIQIARRARGYAPYPILLPFKARQILACGAELKNTFCLTRENHAFLSQHIGDMENVETCEHFFDTIELYKKLFKIEPEIIACDMHPDYLSTRYALEAAERRGIEPVRVQHHHAHIISCLSDNNTEEPAIGVALDGTGYGTDGTIWGGEFLLVDRGEFRRLGHLESVPLPGGAAAIRRPYRMALSYLYTLLGDSYPLQGLPVRNIDAAEHNLLKKQISQRINSPMTSSAGRCFDAAAALLGVRKEVDYEAQAAVELEALALDSNELKAEPYPFSIETQS